MSLINQMLKDLEKRRSRDLETSESLSKNITWETRPASRHIDLKTIALIGVLFASALIIAYLFWERSEFKNELLTSANKQTTAVKQNIKSTNSKYVKESEEKVIQQTKTVETKVEKPVTIKLKSINPSPVLTSKQRQIISIRGTGFHKRQKVKVNWADKVKILSDTQVTFISDRYIKLILNVGMQPDSWKVTVFDPELKIESNTINFNAVSAEKEKFASQTNAEDIETDNVVDTEEIDSPVKLNKKHRPLNNKQKAEIEYKKGYLALQRGRMRQGKERLREALSIYAPHIKSRETLAGIYIKSGSYVDAAELLREGIRVVPTYSLFTKLYARVLLEQKNPQLALKVLEQGTAQINIEPDYFALLAATYQRVKNHEKAIALYLQLVKIRSNEGIWWLGLGISLEKSGKNKEALEAYQRAQKTGRLKAGLIKFTNNRVSALKEIGFPESY